MREGLGCNPWRDARRGSERIVIIGFLSGPVGNVSGAQKVNKIYRTVWSDTLRSWVAVPETAKARGKSGGSRVVAAGLLGAAFVAGPAWASDLNGLNGRLTDLPLAGSVTAALNQMAQAAPSQVVAAAPVQQVLQSATFAAMSGVSQASSPVAPVSQQTQTPVMAFGGPVDAVVAPVAAIVAPLTGGQGSVNVVTETVATVVQPVQQLVPSLGGGSSSPLAGATAPLAAVTEPLAEVIKPVAAVTQPVLTAVAEPVKSVTSALAPVTTPLNGVVAPVGQALAPVTSVVSNVTAPLAGLPVLGPLLSPTPTVGLAAASGSVAPPAPAGTPSGLVIGTAGVLGGVGQGLAPLTLGLFGQQEAYLRSGMLAINRENINARFRVVNVAGLPLLDLAPVTGTLAGTLGGGLPNQNLTLLGGVTSGNYITNINSGLTYNNGVLLPGTTPPSYVQNNNCANLLGLVGATCWDVPAAQNNQVLIGDGASANGSQEVVIGTNAKHILPNEDAGSIFTDPNMVGVPDTNYAARKGHSVVIGDSASGTANGQTILGASATSSVAGGVAIGFQSVADRVGSGVEAYSGVAVPTAGAVSVGAVGRERQITNVAGGTVDTDAVNLRQLRALESQISTGDANAVQYDNAGKTLVTLAGGAAGTRITNVAAGAVNATSTDAVNGAQLDATNTTINNVTTTVTNLDNSVNNINVSGTRYYRANSTLAASDAAGTESIAAGGGAAATAANTVALGSNASASQANSVALGAGSSTAVGARTGYTGFALTPLQNSAGEVSVGSAGAERQITHVAAGSNDTDATNVAQLRAVSNQIGSLDQLAVKYDDNSRTSLTLNPGGPSTRITNLGPGAITMSSTDAINGGQLWGWTQDTTNIFSNVSLYNSIQNLNPDAGSKYFRVNSALAGATASGTDAVAIGPESVASGASSVASGSGATASGTGSVATGNAAQATGASAVASGSGAQATADNSVALGGSATASGTKATAVGSGSQATGTNATALGADSQATANNALALGANADASAENAVALGNGSVADRANTVSVGAAGSERQVTNVARGTQDTDAVNVAQLKEVSGDVTNVIEGKAGMFQVNNTEGRPQAAPTGVDTVAGGAGAKAEGNQSTALGNAASSGGVDAVAVGNAANASGANSVAVGKSAAATGADATAVGQAALASGTNAASFGKGANASGQNATALSTGSVASGNNSVAVGNAAAASGAGSTAVGQAALASGANAVSYGNGANASGQNATALSTGSVASGNNAVAVGNAAQATGAGGVALGTGAQALSSGSVAIGNNSVADRPNTVSMGSAGNERIVSNVAAGQQGTDAVNLQQLRDATGNFSSEVNNLRGDLRKYERNSYAGAASAMAVAGLPQAYTPGKSMASAAASTYLGQSAIAIGVSTITDNGRWVYRLSGNMNSQGKLGAVVGAGYQW